MMVRLFMHPLAEDVFIFLSLGLILLSVGLVGSLLWSSPADDLPLSSQVAAASGAAMDVASPANGLSLACANNSGFVARDTLPNCLR